MVDIISESLNRFINEYQSELNVDLSTLELMVNKFIKTSIIPPFNDKQCYCRTNKNGYSKQCTTLKKDNSNYCKLHSKKISETKEGVWKLGDYNDEMAMYYLSGKDKGKSIPWKLNNNYHSKPKGRKPIGKEWDTDNGIWIDKPGILITNAFKELKVSELKKKALKYGISKKALDLVDDEEDIRSAIINLLEQQMNNDCIVQYNHYKYSELKQLAMKYRIRKDIIDSVDRIELISIINKYKEELDVDLSPSINNDDGFFIFEGVKYMWDTETNEIFNCESYTKVGKLSDDKKNIRFEDEYSEEYHLRHDNNINNI